jgi:light-regulated signal transduction histidine kinase (bacteriophytochrome)
MDFWKEAIHPNDLEKVQKGLSTALENPKENRWEAEYKINNNSGKIVYVIDRGLIIRDNNGKPIRMIGAMTDITKSKLQEQELLLLNESLQTYAKELEHSNEELEQFAFVTSHDLQEPLRMISSFMDQLKRKYGDQLDEKAHQYIHFATDGAKRMKQIILDLLEYSRAGKPNDSMEQVDLNQILSDFKQLRRKIILEKSVTIPMYELPIIYSSKAAITQILHSLFDNAIKYSKKGIAPHIEINVNEYLDEWKFSIKDNGIGIHSEFYDKIFIIFQRLHNRNKYDGTGIGLSIAKKHVEFLGGKIWVESMPGEGSTFYFTIKKTQ